MSAHPCGCEGCRHEVHLWWPKPSIASAELSDLPALSPEHQANHGAGRELRGASRDRGWRAVSSGAQHTSRAAPITVCVQHHPRGYWEVITPDRRVRISYETFDDARRIAFLAVAHARSCELIVRDAYNRIVEHELIDGHRPSAATSRSGAFQRNTNPGGQ